MVRGRGQGPRRELKTQAWRRTREIVLQRDGYECQMRGPRCTGRATQVDHIIPKVHGGDESLDNLRAACQQCNAAAGGRRGRLLKGDPDPRLPSLISLSEPLSAPQRRRTHRQVPE